MSEAKFTKGQWRVQMTETKEGRNILEVVTNAFDVCCYRLGIRNKHDAHLVAAAPEMYKMLDLITDSSNLEDAEHALRENFQEILKLLAKARGEKNE